MVGHWCTGDDRNDHPDSTRYTDGDSAAGTGVVDCGRGAEYPHDGEPIISAEDPVAHETAEDLGAGRGGHTNEVGGGSRHTARRCGDIQYTSADRQRI